MRTNTILLVAVSSPYDGKLELNGVSSSLPPRDLRPPCQKALPGDKIIFPGRRRKCYTQRGDEMTSTPSDSLSRNELVLSSPDGYDGKKVESGGRA